MNDARNVMTGNGLSRVRRNMVLVAAAGVFAACSTYSLGVHATGDDKMNPNRMGGSGTLQVYAFFLKKTDAFEQKDKTFNDFLSKEVVEEGKLPGFLQQEAVDVKRIEVPAAPAGKTTTVKKEFEVPTEVTSVGLVAAFQSHRDNDPDEVWKLVLPVSGSAVAFEINGKRLAVPTPKKKEAARATSDG